MPEVRHSMTACSYDALLEYGYLGKQHVYHLTLFTQTSPHQSPLACGTWNQRRDL
jgi:hypothetical protein